MLYSQLLINNTGKEITLMMPLALFSATFFDRQLRIVVVAGQNLAPVSRRGVRARRQHRRVGRFAAGPHRGAGRPRLVRS